MGLRKKERSYLVAFSIEKQKVCKFDYTKWGNLSFIEYSEESCRL
jgi:hypothetical protein